MEVSARIEYASLAAMELACRYASGVPARVKDIAAACEIPQGFLVQLLLQMKAAGIVTSVRGASGGYRLARPPETITLAEVIGSVAPRATAGVAAARPGGKAHAGALREQLGAIWRELAQRERALLEQWTLRDLIPAPSVPEAMYYI